MLAVMWTAARLRAARPTSYRAGRRIGNGLTPRRAADTMGRVSERLSSWSRCAVESKQKNHIAFVLLCVGIAAAIVLNLLSQMWSAHVAGARRDALSCDADQPRGA